jgi:hypothetical protein
MARSDPYLITCEHGGNRIPPRTDMARSDGRNAP